MGFFSRKPKESIDDKFKKIYQEINQLTTQAGNELDFVIKHSLLQLASQKYQDLLDLIDKGANFEKAHFVSLKESVDKEKERVKGFIDED